jgi:hypothetical protein
LKLPTRFLAVVEFKKKNIGGPQRTAETRGGSQRLSLRLSMFSLLADVKFKSDSYRMRTGEFYANSSQIKKVAIDWQPLWLAGESNPRQD